MLALRRRLLWLLMSLAAAATLAIAVRQDPSSLQRLSRVDLMTLGEKLAVIVFGGALVLSLFRERLSQSLEYALIWVVAALLLVAGYSFRVELRATAEQVMTDLIAARAAARPRLVEITRDNAGEFAVPAQINGAKVGMVLDTGASAVVLTYEAARAAGLPLEVLNYSIVVDTANGRARAAPVTLDRLAIGGVLERSISALIAPPGQLKTSLLGMSFLNRLESWEVRGDRLLLRGYP